MVDRYFAEYSSHHTDRRNLICHEVGIPLIVWAIFSLLELVKLGPVNAAVVLATLVIIFYLTLDVRLALLALLAFGVLYLAGRYTPWPVALAALLAGWIMQFVGHGYEGKKPAFFTNLIHLLVGPLWICSLVMRRRE